MILGLFRLEFVNFSALFDKIYKNSTKPLTKVRFYANICAMNYEIKFFNDAVYKETMNLPSSLLAQLLRVFDLAEIYGANLGRPHSAPLGNGLFEFRAKGKEGIARSIFVSAIDKKIVILHTIVKKSPKISQKDLDLAKKRARELK